MGIEKLRENARREAAEAAANAEARKTRVALSGLRGLGGLGRAVPSRGIVGHAVFIPAIAIWGALLAGLCVMMVSGVTIARLAISAGIGSVPQFAFALTAAVIGGAIAFVAAHVIRAVMLGSSDNDAVAAMAAGRVRPIDPGTELGSDSLDAPISEMPFAQGWEEQADADDDTSDEQPFELDSSAELGEDEISSDAWLDAPELADEDTDPDDGAPDLPACRVAAAGPFDPTPAERAHQSDGLHSPDMPSADSTPADRPRALELGEFAALSGRNGVWVTDADVAHDAAEDAEAEPQLLRRKPQTLGNPQPEAELEVEPEAAIQITQEADLTAQPFVRAHANDARTAIEKLRGVPPQELSLVQMVERFAAALHENQDTARKLAMRGATNSSAPPRDAALAQALKALALFTERGFDADNTGEISGQPVDMVGETERELRNALSKLQNLRGAA